MGKIAIGALMVIGGLSGSYAIRGTDSTTALAILGLLVVGWGIVDVVRRRR